MKTVRSQSLAALGAGICLLASCASTPPAAKFSQALSAESRVGPADQVRAAVKAPGVSDMLEIERTRLAQRIEERINAKKGANPQRPARKLQVDVTVVRYDKGSAFARAMLAGLGQIHLDGTVRVCELPAKRQISEFQLNKTFAWGGIYGASVTMEDIERSFAEGVAAAVTGTKEKSN